MSLDWSSLSSEVQLPVLEDAQQELTRERRQLQDERDAFERFTERVLELETVRPPVVDGTSFSGRLDRAKGNGIHCVRTAYTETVLSVPHYLDIDESVAEHLAGELNEELAIAITQGTHLHSQLKRSLTDASTQAVTSRETLLELIADERRALETASTELTGLIEELQSLANQPLDRMEFNALRLTRARVHQLRDQCNDLIETRQESIRRRRRSIPAAGDELGVYLYSGCQSSHPVLSAIAGVGELIESLLARIERNLLSSP